MKQLLPKFSIIMPCYNSQDYIKNALESIIHQSYDLWELIAINDGSTDTTLTILEEYASKDNRIKIFSKINGGYVSAVNLGLDKISGDYFLFLGSDDYLSTTLFENLHNEITNINSLPDCIAFKTIKITQNNEQQIDKFTNFHEKNFIKNSSLKELTHNFLPYAYIFHARDTSKCFKTSLLNNLKYFGKYGIDSDGIFSMLFCHNASSFLNVPCDGYFWNLRSDSVSSVISDNKKIDMFNNWTNFYKILSKKFKHDVSLLEIDYIYYCLKPFFSFSASLKNAFNYYFKIKKTALSLKKSLKIVDPTFTSAFLKTIAFSPIYFSLSYKRKLKK